MKQMITIILLLYMIKLNLKKKEETHVPNSYMDYLKKAVNYKNIIIKNIEDKTKNWYKHYSNSIKSIFKCNKLKFLDNIKINQDIIKLIKLFILYLMSNYIYYNINYENIKSLKDLYLCYYDLFSKKSLFLKYMFSFN